MVCQPRSLQGSLLPARRDEERTLGTRLMVYLAEERTLGTRLMVYLAAQPQNKLIQFPVCANVGVRFTLDILSQACEKHIQTRFSL